MRYKVSFHALIDGKKQNLDAVFESVDEPSITDSIVAKAAMTELASIVEPNSKVFTIEFHLDQILPLV